MRMSVLLIPVRCRRLAHPPPAGEGAASEVVGGSVLPKNSLRPPDQHAAGAGISLERPVCVHDEDGGSAVVPELPRHPIHSMHPPPPIQAFHPSSHRVGRRRSEEGGTRREEGGARREEGGARREEGGARSEEGGGRSEEGGARREERGGRNQEGGTRREERGGRNHERDSTRQNHRDGISTRQNRDAPMETGWVPSAKDRRKTSFSKAAGVSAGIQGRRDAGIQGRRNTGTQEHRDAGILPDRPMRLADAAPPAWGTCLEQSRRNGTESSRRDGADSHGSYSTVHTEVKACTQGRQMGRK